ncbi:FAD-dependent oxidoreductase [Candidatus Methylacidithermus pantelleriae]|uniref:Nitrite reductase n=1 Tax=Candidatus Methylacidithermus pantelleriae TaxID=2744239 RepID=A0A8J2FRK3_9BACT|nr:FAD-dependent oxidoreductase [Candidatus Methylacidithermus pantelleriae]CAF0691898.1 Nitrite reductase [Candidatus Methylacidithermus pantelleriae]
MRTRRRRLLLVGNGMAGARFLEELLTRGGTESFEVEVFGEEPTGGYNRVLLSHILEGAMSPWQIITHPPRWYREHGMAFHCGVRVDAIARADQAVHGSDGRWYPYDVLVLATGSRPHVPPLKGLVDRSGKWRNGVFTFRTLGDCRRILRRADRCRRAVVVGGGLLGLEAAWGLACRGLEVHLVHIQGHLMEQQLDPQAGQLVAHYLEARGICVHLRKVALALLWKGNQLQGVSMEGGETLPADLVVIATGVRPETRLAASSGLAVNRGIVVDDKLRSVTDEKVYAIGDCIEHRGKSYGLVAPAWEQARVLAEHVIDPSSNVFYRGSVVGAKLKVAGLEVVSVGRSTEEPKDQVILYTEPARGIYRKLLVRDGRLAGAILIGEAPTCGIIFQYFERGLPVPQDPTALLFDWASGGDDLSLGSLSKESLLCQCNGVTRARVMECVLRGARSWKEVAKETRAGTGCGGCRNAIEALLTTRELGISCETKSLLAVATNGR